MKKVSNTPIYIDLDLNFKVHPLTGDLPTKKNNDCIKQSLRNIFFLEAFDIPFEFEKKSGLQNLLFENAGQLTESAIKAQLEWLINRLETRIDLKTIEVLEDGQGYRITILYTIRSIVADDRFDFYVQKTR